MKEDLYTNLGLIFLLILLNGLFSLSEMAIVSSTRARLQKLKLDYVIDGS